MLEGPSILISRELPESINEESVWNYNAEHVVELSGNKRPREQEPEEEDEVLRKTCKPFDDDDDVSVDPKRRRVDDPSDIDLLFHQLGRDISLKCLLGCSRADLPLIASLNTAFRDVIRSGDLYKLRREAGIVEFWVYFSCQVNKWEAFDPNEGLFMTLPLLPASECFLCSDKESLAVGTDLLVFGKEIAASVIYTYSILTNSWSSATSMITPRCLFASGSLRGIGIVAGGCGALGCITSVAELYNSDTQTWEALPSMNKARKMCSGAFMDGKFYVVGGIGLDDKKVQLSCGEEFDLTTRTWRLIPEMFPRPNRLASDGAFPSNEAPPLIAVVGNELYAASYAEDKVRKYKKEDNSWVEMGGLPSRVVSYNGWGLAFRACGDQLIVIGAPRDYDRRFIEIYGCAPGEGALKWKLLGRRCCGNFVYNCTVMGC